MRNNLTSKEKMLLQDQIKHEELCIQKYQSYANQAQCQELKQLFTTYAQQEQQHLNTLQEILNGQIPTVSQQSSQQQQSNQPQRNTMSAQSNPQIMMGTNLMGNSSDEALCTDALTTEKYVSGTYDTTIFEFTNPQLRQVLNHIQKEEQQHGEGIFNYMQNKGLYNPQ